MTRILLVEDDRSLGATLRDRLAKESYEVVWAHSKKEAIEAHRAHPFDLYIFDVGLPDGSGFELAKEVGPRPFIFLTAQSDAESRLHGYELGAEEYVPKPFHLRELLLRVRHVLDNHLPAHVLQIGDVRVDFDGYSFERAGKKEVLAVKDLQLLKLLVETSPKVLSRDEALNLLWGEDNFPSTRTVDNSVLRLRSALGDSAGCIESVRGVGYRVESARHGGRIVNQRFQNALRGIAQATPPIWFMRQAGRYHAHYQKLRKAHSFMELCKQPKLACEVAMGPIEDFDFDVAILFSDLLFPLEALGMGLTYDPSPRLSFSLDAENLRKLRSPEQAIQDLEFQRAALQLTRKALPSGKSLIGFVGGPWTLFSYAVEGEHKGHLIPAKKALPLYPAFCEKMLPLLTANIQLQLEGGAEVVMIFDTAAGELSPRLFNELLAPQLSGLARRFAGRIGYYAKGTTPAHVVQLRTHADFAGFGFDHRWDLAAELKTNSHGFLQGSFDQALLHLKPSEFRAQLEGYARDFLDLTPVQRRHWVCGLGHGVLPETPEENVRTFVQYVREVFV